MFLRCLSYSSCLAQLFMVLRCFRHRSSISLGSVLPKVNCSVLVLSLSDSSVRAIIIAVALYAHINSVYIVSLFAAFWSDKYGARAIPAALLELLAVAGFAMYLGNFFFAPHSSVCSRFTFRLSYSGEGQVCCLRCTVFDGPWSLCPCTTHYSLDV